MDFGTQYLLLHVGFQDRILSLLTRSVKYWLPPSMYWGITIFTHFEVNVQFFKVSKICQKLLWKSLTLFFVCKAPIFAKNLKGMHIYGKLRYIRFTCKQDLGPKSPGKIVMLISTVEWTADFSLPIDWLWKTIAKWVLIS